MRMEVLKFYDWVVQERPEDGGRARLRAAADGAGRARSRTRGRRRSRTQPARRSGIDRAVPAPAGVPVVARSGRCIGFVDGRTVRWVIMPSVRRRHRCHPTHDRAHAAAAPASTTRARPPGTPSVRGADLGVRADDALLRAARAGTARRHPDRARHCGGCRRSRSSASGSSSPTSGIRSRESSVAWRRSTARWSPRRSRC